MQLPPPVHGASVVNKTIKDSDVINNAFESMYIDISPAKDMSDLGKISPSKVIRFFGIFLNSIFTYLRFRPHLIYLTLSPHGMAFYKDSLILLCIKLLGGKVVVHMHGKGVKKAAERNSLLLKYYRSVFKNVSVIHLSNSLFKDLDGIRDPSSGIYELNNGIPDEANEQTCPKKVDIINFLYLSNFVRTKGADTLLKAINNLSNKYKGRFKLKLVGGFPDSEFKKELSQIIKPEFKNDVEIIGPLYGVDKYRALQKSDVFILPTRFKNECFPLSILEAMSFRLAIISTREGAIPDIVISEENGFVIDKEDERSLADIISMYIDNTSLATDHGNRARELFEQKYTLNKFEATMVSILTKVVES